MFPVLLSPPLRPQKAATTSLERVPAAHKALNSSVLSPGRACPKLCQISPLLALGAEGRRSAWPASRQNLAGAGKQQRSREGCNYEGGGPS